MSCTRAITITIRPSHYKDDLDTQYTKSKIELAACPFLISLVCEVTKSCNLHFHGIIKCDPPKRGTVKQSIHNYFRKCKYLGFIYLKEITDLPKWYEYIFKEYDQTKQELYFAPQIIIDNVPDFPKGFEIMAIQSQIKLRDKIITVFKDDFISQFQKK